MTNLSSVRRTIAIAAAAASITGALGTAAVASAAPQTRAATSTAIRLPSQYTRQTFDMTGTWRLTSVFTSRLGVPIRPGSFGGNDVFVVLKKQADVVAPPGNEPVYIGSIYSAATHRIVAGELSVSPYVSPRGIVLTMWQGGNPEGFSDAYEAVYTTQSANSTRTPLDFTGTWIDQDHNGGTTTMVAAPGTILLG